MLNNNLLATCVRFVAAALVCVAAIAGSAAASAATFKVLHAFRAGTDGDTPRGQLVSDSAGNLYGTTYYGGLGTYNGTVYMLVRPIPPATAWGYRVIYRFTNSSFEGNGPVGALTIRSNILYGTTHAGANPSCGCGESSACGRSIQRRRSGNIRSSIASTIPPPARRRMPA